jgi:hypothetical protein
VAGRALGGIIGITIFTAIYNNNMSVALPANVAGVLTAAGSPELIPDVLTALGTRNPQALEQIPDLAPSLIGSILAATAEANTYSWKYVWVAISVFVAANALVSCFLEPVAPKMNNHIESALEESEVRRDQMEKTH